MARVGDARDVVAVAEREQREQRERRVLDRVDPAHRVALLRLERRGNLARHLDPDPARLERARRQVERLAAEQVLAVDAAPLVASDVGGDAHAAFHEQEAAGRALAQPREDLGLLPGQRAGVVGHANAAHADEPLVDVELGDVELPAAVQVDRSLVTFREHVSPTDHADQLGAVGAAFVQHDRIARPGFA